MRGFCKALPQDRILHDGDEIDLKKTDQASKGRRIYTISSTGAKLTYPYAMAVLSRYAESLVGPVIDRSSYVCKL